MIIEKLLNLVPQPAWLRRAWFLLLKNALGLSLRFHLVPYERQAVLGALHFCLKAALTGEGAEACRREMVIEVSSICNAKCAFCPYPVLDLSKQLLSAAHFERALAYAAQLGIRRFDLTPYLGEALLDPQFCRKLETIHARFPGAETQFVTNGTLLQRCDCEALLRSGVGQINISFGAWGTDDYFKLYRIDAWAAVYAGVKKLLDTKRALQSKVRIALRYRTLDARKVRALPENQAFLRDYAGLIDEVDYTDVFHDIPSISGQQVEYIDVASLDSSAVKTVPCANLSKVGVSSTGNIFACYCASTDAFKLQDSWFYLGTLDQPFDLDGVLVAKVQDWRSGRLSPCCKTCPIYVPTKAGSDIRYGIRDTPEANG